MIILSNDKNLEYLKNLMEDTLINQSIGEAYLKLAQFLLNSSVKEYSWLQPSIDDLFPYQVYLINNKEKYGLNPVDNKEILETSLLDFLENKIVALSRLKEYEEDFRLKYEYLSILQIDYMIMDLEKLINYDFSPYPSDFSAFMMLQDDIARLTDIDNLDYISNINNDEASDLFSLTTAIALNVSVEEKLFLNIESEDEKKEKREKSLEDFYKLNNNQ